MRIYPPPSTGGGGGGSGDVVGPGPTVTPNSITRMSGDGGLTIKGSSVTVDDSGNIVTTGSATVGNLIVNGTLTGIDTTDIAEGSNLYYTAARADARVENGGQYLFMALHSFQTGSMSPGSSSTVMAGDGSCAGSSLSTDASSSNASSNGIRVFRTSTSAISGNAIITASNEQVVTRAGNPFFYGAISIDRTTNIRTFIGLGAGQASGGYTGSDTLSTQGMGFQYSSARGDTVWQGISRDSGGAQTTTSITGATIGTGLFGFRLLAESSSSVVMSVWQDSAKLGEVTLTTNLVTSTQGLYIIVCTESLTTSIATTDIALLRITPFKAGTPVDIP